MSTTLTLIGGTTLTGAAETPRAELRHELAICGECGTVTYRGKCLAVGMCRSADRAASRQSLRRGRAASSAPAAWSASGRVD